MLPCSYNLTDPSQAVQIFEVLRSIGSHHTFSAGLVIGGKNLKDERARLSRMNILVATPGRLLQHMDQTVGFDTSALQLLVLDEADRILDMGFKKTLSALLAHLPASRQTLLFSATQTASVADLARLSLNDPAQIGLSPDPKAPSSSSASSLPAMPKNLEHHYLLAPLEQKLSLLWSFIKTHLHTKTIVFLSSCKQVRFVFETFCRLHPGTPLLHLHGKQKQSARLTIYKRFTGTSHAVLFATDIAARGLDFPGVDWVVQVDAPEDVETYVHRVGRTARYESKGRALLFLAPSEEGGMMSALRRKGIEVARIKNRPSKTLDVQNQLQSLAFQDPEIKYLGKRVCEIEDFLFLFLIKNLQAFVSYLRSVYLHKDKDIFKIDELPVDKFAESLGLPGTPKIKFLSKTVGKQRKNAPRAVEAAEEKSTFFPDSPDEDGPDNAPEPAKPTTKVRTKYDRMFKRKNQGVLSAHYNRLIETAVTDDDDDDDDKQRGDLDSSDDEFITLKRANHDLPLPSSAPVNDPTEPELSNRKLKLSRTKRSIAKHGTNTKLVFDESGTPHALYEMGDAAAWYRDSGGLEGAYEAGRRFAEAERARMGVADVGDREVAREKKRERKRKRKEREREREGVGRGVCVGGAVVELPDEDDGYRSPEFDDLSPPPFKKGKVVYEGGEDEEALALKVLGSRYVTQ